MPSHRSMQRLGASFLGVVLVGTVVAGATQAQAAAPAPSGLTPNGGAQSGVPTLRWDDARSAKRYFVELSTSPTFSSPLASKQTYNHHYVPETRLPAAPIYWRVRSESDTGTLSAWSTASFDESAQAGPTLQAPDDGAALPQPEEPPVLSWTPVANASSYEVMIDNDPDFVSPTSRTTDTTSYLVPEPQPATTFYWRVRGVLGTGVNTLWSSTRTYAVGGLPEVEPSLPVEHERVEDIVFDWPAVAGAKDYELRISTDQDFNQLVPSPNKTIVVKGTRYSPPTTLDNDEYWWQVRARDNSGNAIAWSSLAGDGHARVPVRHFQRHWPDVPELTYPADSLTAVGNPFFFEWTPVEHASEYELQVGTDQHFSPLTFETCQAKSTTYTPGFSGPGYLRDDCDLSPGYSYFWRVRALDDPAGVVGEWSAIHSFTYDDRLVQLDAPANGASVAVPTLRWHAMQGAESYHVELYSSASGTVVDKTDTYALSWTPTPTAPLDPAKSPYRWVVTGLDHNDHESLRPIVSGQRTFTLAGSPQASGANPLDPLTPTPSDAGSTTFPSLTWEPMAGAYSYRVLVGRHGSGRFDYLTASTNSTVPEKFLYPAATDVTDKWLGSGTYDWMVEAYTKEGAVLGSTNGVGTFTIAPLEPVTGQRVALTGTSMADNACTASLNAPAGPTTCEDLRQTPVLDWKPVPGAGHYMIYLFKDDKLTNSVYPRSSSNPFHHIVTTRNTRWTPTELLADNQAGDGYYWFIRPCKVDNVCAPDPVAASNTFDKSSLPIDVSDPRNSETAADEVELYWQGTLAENQEHASGQRLTPAGETTTQPTVEAMQYRVQVSDDRTFAKVLRTELVDQPTFTPYSLTLPEGPLYWRVQAIDGSGNSLTWSPTMTIDKRSPTVVQLEPGKDSVVSGTPAFRWQPQDFAGSYDIEVYKNHDTTMSLTNRVISKNTNQPAFTAPDPLPVSQESYLWRVRRLDADRRPGRWTALRAFTVNGQAPAPTSPQSAAFVKADGTVFSWEAVAGATTYRIEGRRDGASYSSLNATTFAQAWAPTSVLSEGAWEWRVSSVDARAKVIASSQWRPFAVDGTAPTVTAAGRVSPTSPDTNWRVAFSEPVSKVTSTTVRLFVEGRSDPVAIRITRDSTGRVWTVDPADPMEPNLTYTLKVGRGITDRADNPLATAGSYAGVYRVDLTRPRVVRKAPGRRTGPRANWVVTFSEPVRNVTRSSMQLYRAGSARPVRARITKSNHGRTWTLNPSKSMSRKVRYTLRLKRAIIDKSGNHLAATSYSSRVR